MLLDTREVDEYSMFHIVESLNFPRAQIKRDKTFPALYYFKNKSDKKIIIYHNDERKGVPLAKHFFEKGFDNIFLLSGGIEKFLYEFPELVEGKKVPVLPKVDKSQKKVLKRSNYNTQKENSTVSFKKKQKGGGSKRRTGGRMKMNKPENEY